MELQTWVNLLFMVQILQDFLEHRVYSVPSPTHCYADQYLHKEQCCRKCSPGQKVKEHCLVGKPNTTKCQDCTKGTYQPESNGEMYCRHCDRQIKSNRKILSNCTKLHNKKYGDCVKGFFYKEGLDDCVKCTWCPIGVGVEQECTKTTDTKCSKAKCPLGTYSDKVSPTQKCRPCTQCKVGEEMFRECTATNNFGCLKVADSTKPTLSKASISTEEVLISSILLRTSNTESPSSRGWVMPFFVSSMALLLFLFLGFVIGVTIWCHRQSRTNESRETAEVPKCLEEDQSTLLPKEERYQIVSVPNHKQMFETGMMLRNVSHDIIEELAKYLNPVNPSNNWKKVASLLGFSWNLISNLDLKPTTATQELLERWGTKREATVYKLYMILKEIDRDDAAEVLERVLRESSPNFPRSV